MDTISGFELDILKELGNIGAGHAATSLSQMIGRIIELTVPKVNIVSISKIHTALQNQLNGSDIVAGVFVSLNDLENEEVGYIYILFPKNSSKALTSLLLGNNEESEEMLKSALIELGNILSSSFCNATAELLDTMLIPTPPGFAVDYVLALIESILPKIAEKSDNIILFEAQLKDESNSVSIMIMFIPDEKIMKCIRKLRDMVE